MFFSKKDFNNAVTHQVKIGTFVTQEATYLLLGEDQNSCFS